MFLSVEYDQRPKNRGAEGEGNAADRKEDEYVMKDVFGEACTQGYIDMREIT